MHGATFSGLDTDQVNVKPNKPRSTVVDVKDAQALRAHKTKPTSCRRAREDAPGPLPVGAGPTAGARHRSRTAAGAPPSFSQRDANAYLKLLVLALIQQLFETEGTFRHHRHWHLPGRSRRRAFQTARLQTVPRGVAPAMTYGASVATERRCAGARPVPARPQTSPWPGKARWRSARRSRCSGGPGGGAPGRDRFGARLGVGGTGAPVTLDSM